MPGYGLQGFPPEFKKKYRREILEEPTEWDKVTKYHLFFGDIRNNTTKKMYILGKAGFVYGVYFSLADCYILPHPKNPGSRTARYFAQLLARNVPLGMFSTLFFGASWYAWNTYFDRDNLYGVFFAANATWAVVKGPILKKYKKMHIFWPMAFILGLIHVSGYERMVMKWPNPGTAVHFCNPRHYEKDLFGNPIRPMPGVSYDIDESD
ncbi:uncharacterized protein LOC134266736 [Saccostrea cucullata]|uniref:uncharacterized protein LOC134266736 n=1 Tax=Saccostrea cuccullata TaxID=36930 RepID=UPI002ED65FA3